MPNIYGGIDWHSLHLHDIPGDRETGLSAQCARPNCPNRKLKNSFLELTSGSYFRARPSHRGPGVRTLELSNCATFFSIYAWFIFLCTFHLSVPGFSSIHFFRVLRFIPPYSKYPHPFSGWQNARHVVHFSGVYSPRWLSSPSRMPFRFNHTISRRRSNSR